MQASPAERPERQELLGAFQGRFRRPEGAAALERSTTGLLTGRPTKNGDTSAQAVPGTRAQRRQAFLTTMPGDEDDLNRQRVQKLIPESTPGDGVLVREDAGVPKQGKASVGVARQDAGALGKVGSGQIAATCCDTDPQATGPVAVRWYLPEGWVEAPERRRKARLPAEGPSQTKPATALTRLDQARAWGVPHRGVVAGADDGDHPHRLAGLKTRPERSVVGGRADFRVRLQRPATGPAPRGDQGLQARPRRQWRTVRWRQGRRGWLRKKCLAVRCRRVTTEGRRYVGWLLGERATRGQPEERQYDGSSLPASATGEELADYAPRRYAVEPSHEEAKGELGWGQSQGRVWPGLHRHAVTVMLA